MSRRFPWYKRYQSDALNGKMGLPPADRGVYDTIIDLCYDRAGPIVDDEVELARINACSTRLYRSIRDRLLKKQKLTRLADGRLICRGFRHGSDEYRPNLDPTQDENGPKTPRKPRESSAKPTSPDGKSKPYEASSRAGARAQGENLDARDETRPSFKPTVAIPEVAFATMLCKELGTIFEPAGERKNWPGILKRMIEEDGLEFEGDILGALRAMRAAGRLPPDVRTPSFFKPDALRMRATRLSAPPPPKQEDPSTLTAHQWNQRLTRFLECGYWIGPGSDPLSLACAAPAPMLHKARKTWEAQGNHPQYADAEGNFAWAPKVGSRGMGSDIFPQVRTLETAPPKAIAQ